MTDTTITDAPHAARTSATNHDVALLAGRLLLAAIFVLSGIAKLGDQAGTVGYIASVGLPLATLVYWATVVLEVGVGLALVAGFKTRISALLLAGFSIAAAVIFHSDFGDQSQLTAFLKNLAIAGGLLAVFAAGPGRFSLDRG